MKGQNRKQSRQKGREKKKRHRKDTLQKQVDFPNQITEIIGDFTVHLTQYIGQGTYGKVYKATKAGSEEQFACKFIKKSKIDDLQMYYKDKKVAEQLQLRLKTQGEFQLTLSECQYIARMFKTEKTEKGFYFIMEYCESDLAKILKEVGFLSQEVALKYFKQILEGIKYIYQKNAFHRDLKPQNLLLKDDMIKISDFGFVKIFTQIGKQCKSRRNRYQTQSKVGTFRYMSPDILSLLSAQAKQTKPSISSQNRSQNQSSEPNQNLTSNNEIQSKYDPQKSDIWSLGIILYKMLYGKEPYDGKSFDEMIKKINEKKLDFPGSIQILPSKIVKTKVSQQVIKLIKKMLTPNQMERISFMKLHTKLNLLLDERDQQKLRSGIQNTEQQVKKNLNDQNPRNEKQRLLTIYNKIIIRIYKDTTTYATVLQIGIQNYSEFAYKIMTLLHEKRTQYLESDEVPSENKKKKKGAEQNVEVDQKVKQQISQYYNVFYEEIKRLGKIKPDQTLKSLLITVYKCLGKYQDFQLLIKQVQLFLLFLLQLLCLQMGIIKEDYMCATQDKAQTLKTKSLLDLKNDAMKMIADSLNGGQSKEIKRANVSKQQSNSKQKQKKLKEISRHKQRESSKSKGIRQKSVKRQKTKPGKQGKE